MYIYMYIYMRFCARTPTESINESVGLRKTTFFGVFPMFIPSLSW